MIQVSNVLADKSLAIDDESNRVLEICAESENGTLGWKFGSGAGGVSARTAKNCGAESADASDRVIHATSDGPFAD
jgi:hypothetical protein